MSAPCRVLWSWLKQRSVIGSDAMILWGIGVHIYESCLFLFDPTSWGSIGMASLLRLCGGYPVLAACLLAATVLLAGGALWTPRLSPYVRLFLLMPQMTLFLFSSFCALLAALHGSYADFPPVLRSHNFIASDQIQRIGFPYLYAVAVIARAKADIRSRVMRDG